MYIVPNRVVSSLQASNWIGLHVHNKNNIRFPVYYETYDSIKRAIEREKQLKNWKREWKLDLIRKVNPKLKNIWPDIVRNTRFTI